MKISREQLETMIKEALEERLKTGSGLTEVAEPGTEVPNAKDMVAFLRKFDVLIEKAIDDARALADSGEELIQTNLLSHPEVGTRNELLKNRVGMLRAMANNMATVFERIKRFEP